MTQMVSKLLERHHLNFLCSLPKPSLSQSWIFLTKWMTLVVLLAGVTREPTRLPFRLVSPWILILSTRNLTAPLWEKGTPLAKYAPRWAVFYRVLIELKKASHFTLLIRSRTRDTSGISPQTVKSIIFAAFHAYRFLVAKRCLLNKAFSCNRVSRKTASLLAIIECPSPLPSFCQIALRVYSLGWRETGHMIVKCFVVYSHHKHPKYPRREIRPRKKDGDWYIYP